MLSLVMNPGLPEEESFALAVGSATVGRTRDNSIAVTHKSLSRRHAQIDYDGDTVRIVDLQSKNGIFVNGVRVPSCELAPGDTFRCGDVTFLIDDGTKRKTKISAGSPVAAGTQTLPSPFLGGMGAGAATAARPAATKAAPSVVTIEDEQRYKDKLFVLIRGTELLVGDGPLERVLEELVALAAQVLEVDRLALLVVDEATGTPVPRVVRTYTQSELRPYSKRVVDWVLDHGTTTSFADVSTDKTLLGDAEDDHLVRAAMAVPLSQSGRTIGVLYADSLSHDDLFRPDDLAVLRALANMACVAMRRANPG